MAKLLIHGRIGGTYFDDVSSTQVIEQLDEFDGENVHVHINSGGGDVFHGIAIYQALKDYKGDVIVHVDALAASAASMIAMAGNEIIMGDSAMMMIHNPWSFTIGDARDHRKNATTLDSVREATLNAYIYQTSKTKEALRELLDAETWLDAEEAVAQGFATSVDGATDDEDIAALANLDFSAFQNVPQRLRARVAAAVQSCRPAAHNMAIATDQGNKMTTGKKKSQKTKNQTDEPADVVDVDQALADEREATNARMSGIRDACKKAKLGDGVAFDLIQEGISLDAARAKVLDMLAAEAPEDIANVVPQSSRSNIDVLVTSSDNFRAGAVKSILARAGLEKHDSQNTYSSYTLMDLCRAAAMQANISQKGKGRMTLIGEVFSSAGHTTSDFAFILSNALEKAMLAGWTENPETFQDWTRKGSLSDFKIAERVALGLFGEFDEIPDGGAYQQGTLSDTGEKIQLATYGKTLVLSRKAILNDDLNLFSGIPKAMGRAAARTIGTLTYKQLTSNPKMRDGTVLFHTNHKNVGANADLAMETLNDGSTAMGLQRDPEDKASALNIRPSYLLVPFSLEKRAKALIESIRNPDNTDQINTAAGTAQVIADGRLDIADKKQWYLAADQEMHDTVEVAYLDGRDQPELEQQRGWTVDGMEYKARIDAAVKPLDFRGLYRGTGA